MAENTCDSRGRTAGAGPLKFRFVSSPSLKECRRAQAAETIAVKSPSASGRPSRTARQFEQQLVWLEPGFLPDAVVDHVGLKPSEGRNFGRAAAISSLGATKGKVRPDATRTQQKVSADKRRASYTAGVDLDTAIAAKWLRSGTWASIRYRYDGGTSHIVANHVPAGQS